MMHQKFSQDKYEQKKASCEFLKAKIACLGEEDAITKNIHSGLLADAASKDVTIATKYESRIEQPLPHLQTFLYFTSEVHKEWQKECQTSIPFNYWRILNNDKNEVEITKEMISDKTFSSLLDHQHFVVFCKVKGIGEEEEFNEENKKHRRLSLFHTEVDSNEDKNESHFAFNASDIKVQEGPQIHPYEPATLYGVICYLWHSQYPLPESVKASEIEEFALKNAVNDIRIAVGYLSFAETHNLEVNVNEWLDKIVVNEREELSIFAASLLLGFKMENVDKEKLKLFVETSLDSLGYYSQNDASIIKLFENETGMRWQFIRSVVRLYFMSTKQQKKEPQAEPEQQQEQQKEDEPKQEQKEEEQKQEQGDHEEEKHEEGEQKTTQNESENKEPIPSASDVNAAKQALSSSSANLLEVEAALQVGQTVTNSLKITNLYAMSEFATISDTQNVIAAALQQLTMKESTSTFANCARAMSTLFLLNRDDMRCTLLIPTNYNVNQRLLSFVDNTMYQKPLVIGSGVIDSIISVLSKLSDNNDQTTPNNSNSNNNSNASSSSAATQNAASDNNVLIPSCFIALLLNLASTESEYSHIIDLITKRVGKTQDFSRRILLHADEYIDADEKMAEFLNFKPPSFIRGLFRSVLKKRKANIPSEKKYLLIIKTLFNKLISKEISVFPDFCYAGMGKIGMEPWKNATNLNKLRLGFNDLQTIMGAHTEISPQNGESFLLFKPISQLEDKDFRETHAWPDAASAKIDFVKVLLQAAVDDTASTVYTNNVFSVVVKNTSLKDLANIVVDRKFMNDGKFSAVTLIFRKLEALLVKAEMEDSVHECVAFHNPNKKMFDDDERINAFYNPNDEKSISISLKYQKNESKKEQKPEEKEEEK